jgi:hypothetical protein
MSQSRVALGPAADLDDADHLGSPATSANP